MKSSGIYTMGVSREQTKALRIYILLKKVIVAQNNQTYHIFN